MVIYMAIESSAQIPFLSVRTYADDPIQYAAISVRRSVMLVLTVLLANLLPKLIVDAANRPRTFHVRSMLWL